MTNTSATAGSALLSKISLKIVAAISMSVLLILTLFIGYIESQSYAKQRTHLQDQQRHITEVQAILLSEQIFNDDEDAVFQTLSGILSNPSIVGVNIEYSDKSSPLQIGESASHMPFSVAINYFDKDMIELGTITTYSSTRVIDDLQKNRFLHLILLVLTVLAAIILVSLVAVQWVVGLPLQRVVQTIENVSDDQAPVVHWQSKDEIGVVVERLNFLHAEQHKRVRGLVRELNESERREAERLRNLANASFEGLLIFDGQKIVDLNRPMAELLGVTVNQLKTKSLADIFEEDGLAYLLTSADGDDPIQTKLKSQANGSAEDPGARTVELRVGSLDVGAPTGRVAVVRDMTERLAAQEKMQYLALYDGLTDLPNRTHFMENLESAIARASRNNAPMAVMYLDLDHFKSVNDNHGHAMGDTLLQAVSSLISQNIREGDSGARLGGDEFAIVLEGTSAGEFSPVVVGNRLLHDIARLKSKLEITVDFGASIGIAQRCQSAIDSKELLIQADLALYEAKNAGRNLVCEYSSDMEREHRVEQNIGDALIHALQADKLELHFQPQVDCKSLQVIGFEGLLRWGSEDQNTSTPELLAIAEKRGIMKELGEWVVRTACREAAGWPREYRVSVNFAPAQLLDIGLVDHVSNCIESFSLNPSQLEFEITETALLTDSSQTLEVLHGLKSLGVVITMDNFGAGYSSVGLLRTFPFDRMKIDRSLISDERQGVENEIFVTALIQLGNNLGIEVIAEGIENQSDLQMLVRLGCQYCQGYHIGKPMLSTEIDHLLANLAANPHAA